MKKKVNILVGTVCFAILSFTASSCTPVQRGAAVGAGVGAAAGAIIGNQSGRAGQGALIGAAAGGLGGALIGDARSR